MQERLESALESMRAHFVEMPGLNLTPAEIRRLCGLQDVAPETCQWLLDRLVKEGVLRRSADGKYRHAA